MKLPWSKERFSETEVQILMQSVSWDLGLPDDDDFSVKAFQRRDALRNSLLHYYRGRRLPLPHGEAKYLARALDKWNEDQGGPADWGREGSVFRTLREKVQRDSIYVT